ncbi:MAG: hypothetical protein QOF45_1143 [Gaiellaceae bacterium]|jgi:hypothetical protein|nr:hypothetical protein [Gaiellaceae bacterium]
MSNSAFVFVLAAGAGVLALWIHARLPKIAPEHVGKTLLHTGLAFALLRLMPGVQESPVMAVVAVVVVVLPALTYALLCSIWMLRHVQTAMGI